MNKNTNTTAPAVAAALAQVKEGKLEWVPGKGYDLDYKAIQAEAFLGYGPAWRQVMAALMPAGEKTDVTGMTEVQQAALVAKIRHEFGYSWGYIATMLTLPAGRVYSLWENATGLQAKGLRIGYGGRFVAGRSDLYSGGQNDKKGSEIKSGESVTAAAPTVRRTAATRVKAAQKRAAKN